MISVPKKVHLFIPCFVDQMFPETGMATVKLLEDAGCEVIYNRNQTCCGQPAFNSGFHGDAASLAKKFVKLFSKAEVVVAPSASCVAMVKKHYQDLDLGGKKITAEYENMRGKIFELSEFLVDVLKIEKVKASFPHKVAYHASCHGYRELGIHDQPLTLLKSVEGIELVELDDRKQCCGFGGTFATKFSDLSAAIGEDKIESIKAAGARYVIATDDSCLMHIGGMIKKKNLSIKTLHYSQILAGMGVEV
jgi:L-lactate dehydrogenase complex protein LldE